MRTAALHYAQVLAREGPFDAILVSDYVNLAELYPLLPKARRETPAVLYFHENQLTYPLQEGEERDVHFALTHLHAMLAARRTLFNSRYHRGSFLDALRSLLKKVPDVDVSAELARAVETSAVLPIGTDVPPGEPRPATASPVILWNHRWEYDKDPLRFLAALEELDRRGLDFSVRLLGQGFRERPAGIEEPLARIEHRIEHQGFLEDRGEYLAALGTADIVVSTACHEFFGLGTLEALRTGCLPLLPDDLAYPELLPANGSELFLYPSEAPLAEALERTLTAARDGLWLAERAALVAHTERFTWKALGPHYDAVFEDVR